MRIIGGTHKGRRFNPPADHWPTRPTTDIAKEALFNILNNRLDFEETRMLDLFGGTGSHCYEFLSRGCPEATYVDKFAPAVRFVRKTAAELGFTDRLRIFQMDVFRFIESAREQYDFIFAGPPYGLPTIDLLPDLIIQKKLLRPEGIFVLEHNQHYEFLEHPNLSDVRRYGKTWFSFFEPEPQKS